MKENSHMQSWAKRGLQTALVTGGLLMLGTGIASAEENVNPDGAPSLLDGGVAVPVHVGNIAVGTPLGEQFTIPMIIDTDEIGTGALLKSVGTPLAPVARGNVVAPNVVAPIEISGWAVGAGGNAYVKNNVDLDYSNPVPITTSGQEQALGGNVVAAPIGVTGLGFGTLSKAEADNTVTQSAATDGDITTDGDKSVGSGNIVALQGALPVGVHNTGAGWGGIGIANGSVDQSASSKGKLASNGDASTIGGNIVGGPVALPVQVDGTAGAWGGNAYSTSTNTVSAVAGQGSSAARDGEAYAQTSGDKSTIGGNTVLPQIGSLAAVNCTSGPWGGNAATECTNDLSSAAGGDSATGGDKSTVGGNSVAAPVGLPVTALGTAGAWGGNSTATTDNTVAATAGGTADTAGDGSTAGGNVVHPQVAGPVSVDCTSGAWGGNTSTECTNDTTAAAGGADNTTGKASTAGGNIIDAPIAAVAQVTCTAGDWGGNSSALCDNTADSTAGGPVSITHGDKSTAGGNVATVQGTPVADVLCNAGAWGGNPSSECTNDETVTAGGYVGTTGDTATGGGNIVQAPLAPVAEVFGVAGAWGGNPTASATEQKAVTAGGGANTDDDRGTVSSNLVTAPLAPVVQVFNIAAAWGGNPTSTVDSDTNVKAGGDNKATGKKSTGSGNIVEAPGALPVQVNTLAATWGGNAEAIGSNLTDVKSGGDTKAVGDGGSVAGNVVEAPLAGSANVFGLAASWIGNNTASSDNDVMSIAGGTVETSGKNGSIAGDVVAAQMNPVAQVFGSAISFVANTESTTTATTGTVAGGPITTAGDGGSVSGDIISAEAQALPQVFGLGIAAAGNATNAVSSQTSGVVGGDETTSGAGGLAGGIFDLPVAADPAVFGWGVGALAGVTNQTENDLTGQVSGVPTGGDILVLPKQLPIGLAPQVYDVTIPVLANVENVVTTNTDIPVGEDVLNVIPISLSDVPGVGQLAATDLPTLPTLPVAQRGDLPAAGLPELPSLNTLPIAKLPIIGALLPSLQLPQVALPTMAGLPLPGARADQPAGLPSLSLANQKLSVPQLPVVEEVGSFTGSLPRLVTSVPSQVPAMAQLDSVFQQLQK
jgi:hypothetical protein